MDNSNLDFLNKNMYRKYPIKGSSTHIFTNGSILPQNLITSLQISTIFGVHTIFINSIYFNGSFINISLKETTINQIIGYFSGNITEENQILSLVGLQPYISGKITIGTLRDVKDYQGMYFLSQNNGLIEDSAIICFTQPSVQKFIVNNNDVTGRVTFLGDNINISTPNSHELDLNIINSSLLRGPGNKSTVLNNCDTPIITAINTVTPDNTGNINIYSIDPLLISINGSKLIWTTPDLTILDTCPEKDVFSPPENASNSYYTNILSTVVPEWKTWS